MDKEPGASCVLDLRTKASLKNNKTVTEENKKFWNKFRPTEFAKIPELILVKDDFLTVQLVSLIQYTARDGMGWDGKSWEVLGRNGKGWDRVG